MSTGDEYTQISDYLSDTDTTYVCYDVTTKDTNGNKVIPAGELTITIDIPEELKNAAGDTYIVFHSEDGTFKKLECTEKDGKITFKANTTGLYTICKYDFTNEKSTNKVAEVETEEIIKMNQQAKIIKSDEVTTENSESTENASNNNTQNAPAQQPAQRVPSQIPMEKYVNWNGKIGYFTESHVTNDSALNTTDMEACIQRGDSRIGEIQFGAWWKNGNYIYFEYITP